MKVFEDVSTRSLPSVSEDTEVDRDAHLCNNLLSISLAHRSVPCAQRSARNSHEAGNRKVPPIACTKPSVFRILQTIPKEPFSMMRFVVVEERRRHGDKA